MSTKHAVVLAAIMVSIIIALIGSIYGWLYLRGPKYSLYQVQKAFKQHDLAAFEKYVDIESTTNNLIDQVMAAAFRSRQLQGEWGQMGQAIGKSLVELVKPQLVKVARNQIVKLVETGSLDKKQENNATQDTNQSLPDIFNSAQIKDAWTFQAVESVKKEGSLAYVCLKFLAKKQGQEVILNLKMRKKEGYWQVIEVSNFVDNLVRLEEMENKKIEAQNNAILKSIKDTLVIGPVKKGIETDELGIIKKVALSFNAKNIGSREIDDYKVELDCRAREGMAIRTFTVSDTENITPGDTGGGIWTFAMDMSLNRDITLFETPEEDLKITPKVQYIKFIDGRELKPAGTTWLDKFNEIK